MIDGGESTIEFLEKIASELQYINLIYNAGLRGLDPKDIGTDNAHDDKFYWYHPMRLASMLEGAIHADRSTTVALIGIAALSRGSRAVSPVIAEHFDQVWQRADEHLAGQQGSARVY